MRFFRWLGNITASVLNGVAKIVVALVLLFLVLLAVGLVQGDGMPKNMILSLDLRQAIADSDSSTGLPFTGQKLTVMNLVLGLDAASRDNRVKGVFMRLGNGAIGLAQAEEIAAALARFRAQKKFVIAQATSFAGAGMGDYVTASAADQIWMQPKSDFRVSGPAAGEIFMRGAFEKIHAEPQIAKRAEYKSAADMYMEKNMTPADREQLTALLGSWYNAAVGAVASARGLTPAAVAASFEASPQFAEEATAAKLVDRIGFDDDALGAARGRAQGGSKSRIRAVKMGDYIKNQDFNAVPGANVAVIEAAGEINDGTAGDSVFSTASGIASDDLSATIRRATRDKAIKAIVLRVDSPGGSVTASDQILDAVKKAQAAGKPVVVSMGALAASGGYYISASANRIVAQPATLTGSIGVLTGKVSFGKSLDMIGVGFDEVSHGKNAMMDSALTPYTPEQWTMLNKQADVIYQDFLQKVSAGRKLPLAKVEAAARGRVWTGADAKGQGLVDELGGFWTARDAAARLANLQTPVLKVYPRRSGIFAGLAGLLGRAGASMGILEKLGALMALPGVNGAMDALIQAPRGRVELRAPNLPHG